MNECTRILIRDLGSLNEQIAAMIRTASNGDHGGVCQMPECMDGIKARVAALGVTAQRAAKQASLDAAQRDKELGLADQRARAIGRAKLDAELRASVDEPTNGRASRMSKGNGHE